MREFQADLAASLASGCTTLCKCVRLTRQDGVVIGLTDHDAPLTFDGTDFDPADGFEASQESAALGPVAGEWDLKAAFSDERLNQQDLLAGRFDGASVETFLVDWRSTQARDLTSSGTLGEVTSRDGLFQAEVRGPFAAFDRVRGRVFAARCDAELGDARCKVNLDQLSFRIDRQPSSIAAPNSLQFAGLETYPTSHFDGGTAHILSGEAEGATIRIRAHELADDLATITLWHAPPASLTLTDTIRLTAGCDKSFASCTQKFANGENFRGFPFMPGDDFALSYPSSEDGDLDGGSFQS